MRFCLNKFLLACSLLVFGGLSARADQIALSQFKLLDSNDNSTTLNPSEAQNLLNVDVSPSGKTIKKRAGYGSYKLISPSVGMHGGYHAFNTTGSDYQLWGTSTSLYGIVADGTPTKIVSSATLNATWDCADTQGSSYCVDSARDAFIRTDGSTLTNWYTTPLGTMVEATPDRVIVAGVAATPNTLFISQSNTFTNYTTGVNATDAFTEVIASPGSHLTHIRWGCQKLLWWKDQSFGYFDFDDQYTAQVKTVSDIIGTFDNTSAIDPGGNVWFRGQDGHTYEYDCSGLQRMTVDITPQIQTSGRRTTNFWQQTTQSDWQTGLIVPTGQLSTTISANDIVPSSFTGSSSISQSATLEVLNNSFETVVGGPVTNWTLGSHMFTNNNVQNIPTCGTISPKDGVQLIFNTDSSANTSELGIYKASDDSLLSSSTVNTNSATCTWLHATVSGSPASGLKVYVKIKYNNSPTTNFAQSDSFISNGNTIGVWYVSGSISGANWRAAFDLVDGTPVLPIISTTSAVYDTGLNSSMAQIQANWSASISSATLSLRTSTTSNGTFTTVLTSSGTNAFINRYAIISSSFYYTTAGVITATSTIVATSSGTFYSTWKNAPNWSAWSTFNPTSQDNGGSHTFYVRASTSPQSITNSTITWVAQSANAQVATSTAGIYFQIRDDFTVPAATNTPTLNDFTVNWFEGSASDQAYMLYFDNAIWESVAYGTGVSSNTYIFRYDLINQGWGLYNFGAGGMLNQGNRLYFGSVSDGNIFQFGSGASDNGNAINAFWKSKDFTGSDPFLQNSLSNIDVFAKKDTGTTLTSTYTTDTSTATAYSIVLSTSNAIVQSRKLLPSGKLGYVFNFQLGDSSTSSQWEVLGVRMGYTQLPYRPTP